MKKLLSVLLFTCFGTNSFAQSTISEVFLLFPETTFTQAAHSPFSKTDSFTVLQRKKLLNGEFDPETDRVNSARVNDSINLMQLGNGPYSICLKGWKTGKNEWLTCLTFSVEDFAMPHQAVYFYAIRNGKIKPVKPMPENFALNLFWEKDTLVKHRISETDVPYVYITFPDRGDYLEVRPQEAPFEADYAAEGSLLPTLRFDHMKREKLLFMPKKGKLVLAN
jgi:hypothetical protein